MIQKKDADDLDFSSVFYFNFAVCLILYAGMFIAAPYIAIFYSDATLTSVIRVLSLTIVISGVKGIRQAIIEFRPRLVVIDPIQAYLGSDSDLQIAGRARKLMRRLGMWAAGYDCAIVLIGHLNKKEGSKGLYRSLGSIDVVAAARSVLQVERDTENPDIRIVHQIKNSLAPTAEDIRFSISADKGFQWLECRPQSFENQKPDRKPEFESEQQKAVYWIKHFLEKGDMSANEIYCRLDNEGVSKRVARMVKTEMGIHCYQKKRRWYWSVQPEEGVVNGPQV